MPSPHSFSLLIGQVDVKRVLPLSTIFHRFSRKCFIVLFLCLTNQCVQALCTQPSTWRCCDLANWIFSLFFFTVVINYRDIVLAQSGKGLLDSFGASSNVTLISALDFNLRLHDPSSALFSLCLLCDGGSSSYRTSCHSSLGADL